jgi:hypothetical protein
MLHRHTAHPRLRPSGFLGILSWYTCNKKHSNRLQFRTQTARRQCMHNLEQQDTDSLMLTTQKGNDACEHALHHCT